MSDESKATIDRYPGETEDILKAIREAGNTDDLDDDSCQGEVYNHERKGTF